MKLAEGVVTDQIGDDYVAVATGKAAENFNGLIRINKTAYFIMNELMQDTDLDKIVKAMLEKYEVDEPVARNEAKKVIDTLAKAGFIVE